MFSVKEDVITSFYGLKNNHEPKNTEKLKAAIEYLGDKYLLAKPVEKKKNG